MKHAIQNFEKESIVLEVLGSGLPTAPDAEEGIYVKAEGKFWVLQGTGAAETCYEGKGWHKALLAKVEKGVAQQVVVRGNLQSCNIVLHDRFSEKAGFTDVKSIAISSNTLQELEVDGCRVERLAIDAPSIRLIRVSQG